MKFNRKDWMLFFCVIFLVALGVVGQSDYNEAVQQGKHYCEMVELWNNSDGENGHPNYDRREC